MKTNQIIVRQLGKFEVQQRTLDSYFNSTDLIKQWDNINPNKKKYDVKSFLRNNNVINFIDVLSSDLKGSNMPYFAKRGKQGGTWMHPYLFIKFAMWINPVFELDVIKFVYDNLIRFRLEGGDSFKSMNIAFDDWMQRNYNKKPEQKDYMRLATIIKTKVGVKDWNKASEKQNTRRKDLEQVYEFAFNNNLSKKETNRMIKFQLMKKIN